jgi:hypothetical protein
MVAFASPFSSGQGGGGIGISKSKSKMNSHLGSDPQLSYTSSTTVTVTPTLGSASHASLPVNSVMSASALIDGQGISGGGIVKSKSNVRSSLHDPQSSSLLTVMLTSKLGGEHGPLPRLRLPLALAVISGQGMRCCGGSNGIETSGQSKIGGGAGKIEQSLIKRKSSSGMYGTGHLSWLKRGGLAIHGLGLHYVAVLLIRSLKVG